ncbi:hypothetical protein MNBD_NITROSPINAE02-1978, partial [hydrothermal vent metagenome]
DVAYRRQNWVEEIAGKDLQKLGARAVILDHDGVLGANRSLLPDEAGLKLIGEMLSAFGPGKVFILSNTRAMKEGRGKAFGSSIPEVIYIRGEKKPGTGGLLMASRLSGVPAKKIVVVDDGLLTGVLMAIRGGAIPFYAKRKQLEEKLAPMIMRLTTTGAQLAIFKFVRKITKAFL